MTYIVEDFRIGNSESEGGGVCAPSRVFQQKLKMIYIYDVFRILFLEEEEAPERRGGRGGGKPPSPPITCYLTA